MTRAFATRPFARWARREGLTAGELRTALAEVERGLVDADLGGGLVKKRLARRGGGKRGGYRVIVAVVIGSRAFFVEGFAKNERSNLRDDELVALRRLGKELLRLDDALLARALAAGKLEEL